MCANPPIKKGLIVIKCNKSGFTFLKILKNLKNKNKLSNKDVEVRFIFISCRKKSNFSNSFRLQVNVVAMWTLKPSNKAFLAIGNL